jgi:hypothetical protein
MKKYEFLKMGAPLTGMDKYRYSQGAENIKLKDVAGEKLTVKNYSTMLQKEINEETGEVGEEKLLLAIEDMDGRVYVTNSGTAREAFTNIVDFLSDDGITTGFDIKVVTGKSKNDREFVTVTL